MKKKVWTPAARAAFALKMKRARAAKRGSRKRAKNPNRKRVRKTARIVRRKTRRVRRKNPAGKYYVYVNGKKRGGGPYDAATAKAHAYAFAYHHPSATIVVK